MYLRSLCRHKQCPFIRKVHCICHNKSGRRGSNSRPLAWKANALSTELLPHCAFCDPNRSTLLSGKRWIRTTEGKNQQIYSLPHLATLVSSRIDWWTNRADGGIRTPDQLITNQLLWPTELHRRVSSIAVQSKRKKLKPQNFCAIFSHFFSMNLIFSILQIALSSTRNPRLYLPSENRCKDRILLWKIKHSGQKICKKSQFFLIFVYTYI